MTLSQTQTKTVLHQFDITFTQLERELGKRIQNRRAKFDCRPSRYCKLRHCASCLRNMPVLWQLMTLRPCPFLRRSFVLLFAWSKTFHYISVLLLWVYGGSLWSLGYLCLKPHAQHHFWWLQVEIKAWLTSVITKAMARVLSAVQDAPGPVLGALHLSHI